MKTISSATTKKKYDPDLNDLIFCFREKGDICVNSFMNSRYWVLTINSTNTDNIPFSLEQNYQNFCNRMKVYLEKSGCVWHYSTDMTVIKIKNQD